MMGLFNIPIDKNRVYGLDILRALAILFVVIGHGSLFLPVEVKPISDFFVFDGVSIFFVLSGFLIGGILIKLLEQKGASYKILLNFWIRRWFRTLPNYYLILLVLFIILPYLFYDGVFNPLRHKEYMLFVQNFNKPHPLFFEEAWSLCVEEWFYLSAPLLIFTIIIFFKLQAKRSILIVAAILIISSMIFRYIKFTTIPINTFADWDINIRKQVLTRLDSIMYGLVGAYFYYYSNTTWKRFKTISFIIGMIILVVERYVLTQNFVGFGLYKSIFSLSLVSLGVLLILPLLSEFKEGSGFFYKFFTKISIISYSMYLLNYTIFREYVLNLINRSSLSGYTLTFLQFFSFWIFTIFGATLLFKYFEKPVMDIREIFRKK